MSGFANNLIGLNLGGFLIQRMIARGGMGIVFEGMQESLNRPVAIKILYPHLSEDESFRERFSREARAIAQLRHPNIVGVIDYGTAQGLHYMVMELISGGSLRDEIARRTDLGQPFTTNEALHILQHVGSALSYAHSRGFLHRDVKPANIMLDNDGQVFLTDFGLVRLADNPGLSAVGSIIGTPEYMAPEQSTGQPDITPAVDQYALAVVAYQLLVGRVPFQAPTPVGVIHKHMHDPPPPPREIQPWFPEAMEQVLVRGLAKKPSERYASIAEFVNALTDVAVSMPGYVPQGPPRTHSSPSHPTTNATWPLDATVAAAGAAAPISEARATADTLMGAQVAPLPETEPRNDPDAATSPLPAAAPALADSWVSPPSSAAAAASSVSTATGPVSVAPAAATASATIPPVAPPAATRPQAAAAGGRGGRSRVPLIAGGLIVLLLLLVGGITLAMMLGDDDDPGNVVGVPTGTATAEPSPTNTAVVAVVPTDTPEPPTATATATAESQPTEEPKATATATRPPTQVVRPGVTSTPIVLNPVTPTPAPPLGEVTGPAAMVELRNYMRVPVTLILVDAGAVTVQPGEYVTRPMPAGAWHYIQVAEGYSEAEGDVTWEADESYYFEFFDSSEVEIVEIQNQYNVPIQLTFDNGYGDVFVPANSNRTRVFPPGDYTYTLQAEGLETRTSPVTFTAGKRSTWPFGP